MSALYSLCCGARPRTPTTGRTASGMQVGFCSACGAWGAFVPRQPGGDLELPRYTPQEAREAQLATVERRHALLGWLADLGGMLTLAALLLLVCWWLWQRQAPLGPEAGQGGQRPGQGAGQHRGDGVGVHDR